MTKQFLAILFSILISSTCISEQDVVDANKKLAKIFEDYADLLEAQNEPDKILVAEAEQFVKAKSEEIEQIIKPIRNKISGDSTSEVHKELHKRLLKVDERINQYIEKHKPKHPKLTEELGFHYQQLLRYFAEIAAPSKNKKEPQKEIEQ